MIVTNLNAKVQYFPQRNNKMSEILKVNRTVFMPRQAKNFDENILKAKSELFRKIPCAK